jgi:hypothetical protein
MQRINPGDFTTQTTTAIQSVCAWPNLHILPDGTILAAIFNQPCHGMWEGDLDLWASTDHGVSWNFRGRIAPFDKPNTNRMNCAFGVAKSGDLVALCAGWTERGKPGQRGADYNKCARLTGRVYRSSDQGVTWRALGDIAPSKLDPVVPFGDIHIAADGRLVTTVYGKSADDYGTRVAESHDDGLTWSVESSLYEHGNETALLETSPGRWLAAVRLERTVHVELFESADNTKTWNRVMPVTFPGQVTSHLTRLPDGRILLSYGNRNINNFGVDVRTSSDEGKTWSAPIRIADCPLSDCGYPDTVSAKDGKLVTAFYTQIPGHYKYEMRVTRWNLPK